MPGSSSSGAGSQARVWVEIRIEGLDRREAAATVEALRPDDATAPEWLRIEEHVENGALVIRVEAVGAARLGSLRNTVDEMLSVIYALLRSIEAAKA